MNSFRTHPFPNILALGILLLEIELSDDVNGYRIADADADTNYEDSMNGRHIKAWEVSARDELWAKKETYDIFKSVVKDCLEPTKFVRHADNPERLRGAIEEHVVEPLRKLYNFQWKDPDTDEVQPAVTRSPTTAPFPASNLSSATMQRDPVAVPLSGSTMSRFVTISKVSN